jgi:hypothetical protein
MGTAGGVSLLRYAQFGDGARSIAPRVGSSGAMLRAPGRLVGDAVERVPAKLERMLMVRADQSQPSGSLTAAMENCATVFFGSRVMAGLIFPLAGERDAEFHFCALAGSAANVQFALQLGGAFLQAHEAETAVALRGILGIEAASVVLDEQ